MTFSPTLLATSRLDHTPARRWLVHRAIAILLAIASGLMALVVIQQDRTIHSQRQLIQQLFQDSLALNAARMKLVHKDR